MYLGAKVISQRGVTLVEILIVVMIALIMATLAAPSFSSFMNNSRQSSVQSQLIADLNRARSEAIKRNSRVLVCNANAALSDCTTSTDWNSGWIVCYDVNADNACDATSASNPNPMVVRPSIHSILSLSSSITPVRFNPTGTQGASGSVTLTIAPSGSGWDGAVTRTLVVSATGNISR